MSDQELKIKFAAQFAKSKVKDLSEAFRITSDLFPEPEQRGYALWAAKHWMLDPEVAEFLPSDDDELHSKESIKEKLTTAMLEILENRFCEPEDKIKASKELRELYGLTTKPEFNNTITMTTNKVMVVKDFGDDAQWEQRSIKQQNGLLNVNNSRRH